MYLNKWDQGKFACYLLSPLSVLSKERVGSFWLFSVWEPSFIFSPVASAVQCSAVFSRNCVCNCNSYFELLLLHSYLLLLSKKAVHCFRITSLFPNSPLFPLCHITHSPAAEPFEALWMLCKWGMVAVEGNTIKYVLDIAFVFIFTITIQLPDVIYGDVLTLQQHQTHFSTVY